MEDSAVSVSHSRAWFSHYGPEETLTDRGSRDHAQPFYASATARWQSWRGRGRASMGMKTPWSYPRSESARAGR